ncbi:uncharacterized protein LOC123266086 [Cotesia glomerata]|uniref:uncharacterized protein LOC123266086 n=1 Tax=Cotesia glomerata TaxID=32391 RepID=UPI001D0246F5|nr:uncharacterized protein LOC123266086 [Cotesia glomerata]
MIPYSKYAWAVPIKNKSANDVTKTMDSILKHGRIPKNLHVNQGKEFYNQEFRNLMKKTLQTNMWRKFTARGTYKWIDMIDDLVNTYNNTKHRTIKMKPSDIIVDNEQDLKKKLFGVFRASKPGDRWREIFAGREPFGKFYSPKFIAEKSTSTTETIFPVEAIQKGKRQGTQLPRVRLYQVGKNRSPNQCQTPPVGTTVGKTDKTNH